MSCRTDCISALSNRGKAELSAPRALGRAERRLPEAIPYYGKSKAILSNPQNEKSVSVTTCQRRWWEAGGWLPLSILVPSWCNPLCIARLAAWDMMQYRDATGRYATLASGQDKLNFQPCRGRVGFQAVGKPISSRQLSILRQLF